ncbi:MAG: hypothetical protein K0V04_06235 [Deltaproteobacteria bacterium]|nr:hypothetical protein [Deltaproteobacteria bacterium]
MAAPPALPHVGLRWHYRCREEEPIAFSNHAMREGACSPLARCEAHGPASAAMDRGGRTPRDEGGLWEARPNSPYNGDGMATEDPPLREQLVVQVLRADDPRACARELADTHRLPPAAVWQWSVEHARRRAAEHLTPAEVDGALRDEAGLRALLVVVEGDRTQAMANRLHELLRTMPVEPSVITTAFANLPDDGSLDHHLEALLFREACPVDLLEQFIERERSVTTIAHRAGPRHLLERVRRVYAFDEPVLTLLRDYYLAPDEPLDAALRFIDEVAPRFADAIEHNLAYWKGVPPERRDAVQARLDMLRSRGA